MRWIRSKRYGSAAANGAAIGGFNPSISNPKLGDTLFFNGSNWINVGSNNFDVYSKWDWDFSGIGSSNPLGFQLTKSANAIYSESDNYGVNSTEKATGVGSLSTGTGTGENIYLSRANYNVGNGSEISIKWRGALEDLSDGTNTYYIYKGLIKPASLPAGATDPNDGIYFKYSHGINGGKYFAVTRAASTSTETDTGVAADNQYHVFEIRFNTDLSTVTFFIDGVQVASHTTNIPTAGIYSLIMGIWQTAGASARKIHFDLYGEFIYNANGR